MTIPKAHLMSYQTYLEASLWNSHWIISDIAACLHIHLAIGSAMLFWLSCLQMPCDCKSRRPSLLHGLQKGLQGAPPWTGWTQLLLVCLSSSFPKRRHPLCSAVCWLTHWSVIRSRTLSSPCRVCPRAGLQAVQQHAGGLKSTAPCM